MTREERTARLIELIRASKDGFTLSASRVRVIAETITDHVLIDGDEVLFDSLNVVVRPALYAPYYDAMIKMT